MSESLSGGTYKDDKLVPQVGLAAASDFLSRAAPAFALREPPHYVCPVLVPFPNSNLSVVLCRAQLALFSALTVSDSALKLATSKFPR
jgi:hypothetical protein